MKNFRVAGLCLLVSTAFLLSAQSPAGPKNQAATSSASKPLVVDVHASPYRPATGYGTNISDKRFDMHDATLLDMITLAWDRREETVVGGPPWIDFYRFDLAAKIDSLRAPKSNPTTNRTTNPIGASGGDQEPDPYKQIEPVLQEVLEQRFHLTYHIENRPLPGYLVTQAKGGAKLNETKQPQDSPDCHGEQDKSAPQQYIFTCTSMTMAQLLSNFGGVILILSWTRRG